MGGATGGVGDNAPSLLRHVPRKGTAKFEFDFTF